MHYIYYPYTTYYIYYTHYIYYIYCPTRSIGGWGSQSSDGPPNREVVFRVHVARACEVVREFSCAPACAPLVWPPEWPPVSARGCRLTEVVPKLFRFFRIVVPILFRFWSDLVPMFRQCSYFCAILFRPPPPPPPTSLSPAGWSYRYTNIGRETAR